METSHADVNLIDKGGFKLLTMACHTASLSLSMYLLEKLSDLDVNFANSTSGNIALHYAIWFSKVSRTKLHKASERHDIITLVS